MRESLLGKAHTQYNVADYEGQPVLMTDGRILDSVHLPQGTVEGHPVTVSADSLMQSIRSGPSSAQGHPITFSGGSIMDSGGSLALSQRPESVSRTQQAVEYHPVEVSDAQTVDSQLLEGKATGPSFLSHLCGALIEQHSSSHLESVNGRM